MHQLVGLQQLTRAEFLRGLEGVSGEDARRRVEPMNCISWMVAHLAHQERAFFVAGARGERAEPRFRAFANSSDPSQPPLEEAMALWREATEDADSLLLVATEESMREVVIAPDARGDSADLGTRIVRNTFHYWVHIGEISAIRQVLGHPSPPEFVTLHGWTYGGS